MGQKTTRIYDTIYTSEINDGMKYHLEVYTADDNNVDEDQEPKVKLQGYVDQIQVFTESYDRNVNLQQHTILRTTARRILTGENFSLPDRLADYCDQKASAADWQRTINGNVVKQSYFKSEDSLITKIRSYINNTLHNEKTVNIFFQGLDVNASMTDGIRKKYDKYREELITEAENMSPPDTNTTVEPVNLPATTSGTYTTESTTYNYRVNFQEQIFGDYTIVTYVTEYGVNNNYNVVYSTKQVEFSSNNYSSAEAYLEAYGNAEILSLQRTLDIADKNLSLVIDAEELAPFAEPQSDKNLVIKDSNKTNHYVPLAQYVDTSSLIAIVQIPEQTGTLTYDGTPKIPAWSAHDESQFVISGDLQGVDAGSYYMILTPATGYMWSNGTVAPRSVEWKIQPKIVDVPEVSDLYFNWEPDTVFGPTIGDYDSDIIVVSGTTSNTAGTHTITFAFKNDIAHNYAWNGNNVIEWTVYHKTIPNPTIAVTVFPYKFDNYYLVIEGFDDTWMGKNGDVASEVGDHNCTFYLKDSTNTVWQNNYSNSNYVIPWKIEKAAVTKPNIEVTEFTYVAGTTYTLTPTNLTEDYLDLYIRQTDTSKSPANSYTGIFGLRDKTRTYWNDADSSTANILVSWKIDKASPETVLDKSSITLEQITPSVQIVVTRSGDGVVRAASTNENVLLVTVNGTVITATATGYGTADITVQILEGTNYKAETGIIIDVTSTYLPPLANCNPAKISAVLKADKVAETGWKAGDWFPVAISGTVGTIQIGDTYRAVLIGIDHNKDQEGSNRLHFIVGQDKTGVNIAFCDNNRTLVSTNGTRYFQHNLTQGSNTGGWQDSALRNRCTEFYNALPDALQNIISPCNKFSDIVGGTTNKKASVVPILDKVWLLSEYEVFGARTKANSSESLNQKRYKYFENSSNYTRYSHKATNQAVDWVLRSPDVTGNTNFVRVYNNTVATLQANTSSGLVFGFTIGDGTEVSILDAISWDSLTEYLKAGTISSYLSVGDTKAITFTPFNQNSFFSKPETYRATVLSLEHNATYEGPNKIHFAINKDKFGNPVALCDGNYGNSSIVTTSYYSQHNQTMSKNSGGWSTSFINTNVLPRYYRDMPQDLQNNITAHDKWTDNVGDTNNVSDSVTITTHKDQQKLWLLSEYEVFGIRTYANIYEQVRQEQYTYFKNVATSFVHLHNRAEDDIPVSWWLRSPNANSSSAFCVVGTNGQSSQDKNAAYYSLGIIPCFTIGDGTVAGLETFSWSQIASYARNGTLADYAKVGDSKILQLIGTVGTKEISGTYRAVIIAMSHNTEVEGANRVHFAIAMDTDKNNIVFTDGMAEQSTDGTHYFQHNLTGVSNIGGWQLSALRDRCQEIYEAIEPELRPYISLHTKYTNNTGGGNIANITATDDYVWIPSYYELMSAGSGYQEATQQAHYEYFQNSNNASVHNLSRTSHEGTTPVAWWTRTPSQEQGARFISISGNNGVPTAPLREANLSAGILPCFVLGNTNAVKDLSSLTWELIKTYTQNGTLLQYAELGQYKPIQITGTFGEISLNGTYAARLIGFNHNVEVEGENRAHFMICASNGSNMAFVDSYYDTNTPSNNTLCYAPFSGYTSSDLDYNYSDNRCTIRDILNQGFAAALPEALQAVIAPCKKYSRSVTADSAITGTQSVYTEDKIWLPGMAEIMSSDIQPNNTNRYSYYATDTLGYVYAHNDREKTVKFWLRDAASSTSGAVWYYGHNRIINKVYLARSLGIIPCFTIA